MFTSPPQHKKCYDEQPEGKLTVKTTTLNKKKINCTLSKNHDNSHAVAILNDSSTPVLAEVTRKSVDDAVYFEAPGGTGHTRKRTDSINVSAHFRNPVIGDDPETADHSVDLKIINSQASREHFETKVEFSSSSRHEVTSKIEVDL